MKNVWIVTILGILMLFLGVSVSISFRLNEKSAKASSRGDLSTSPHPFGITESRAWQYRQCPEILTVYMLVGYGHSSTPQENLNLCWPYFGQIINQECCGGVLGDSSETVIRLTIRKYDCWK